MSITNDFRREGKVILKKKYVKKKLNRIIKQVYI